MSATPAVLVVDPIFRGSRLMYSAYATAALADQGTKVSVLARAEPPTDHYRELFAGIPHELISQLPIPPATWYAKLTPPQLRDCFAQLAEMQKTYGYAATFFSGWNEFFPRLALARSNEVQTLREIPSFFVEYSPFFWLRRNDAGLSGRLQDFAKRILISRWLQRFPKLKFFVLDERLFDPALSALPRNLQDRYLLLPEASPWTGNPAPPVARSSKELLVVGLQTRRKGLEDIAALVEQPDFPAEVRIKIVGRLGDDLQHLRSLLQRQPAARLVWEEAYLSEEEIRKRYAACDYVLVPYTRAFNSTSSVLAWAGAHGKPVVATDHGIVGYRVDKHRLGVVYPSGDVRSLMKQIRQLPEVGSTSYDAFRQTCLKFAENSRLEVFKATLARHIMNSILPRK